MSADTLDTYREVLASIEKKMGEAGGQVTALVDSAADKDYGTAEGVSLLEVNKRPPVHSILNTLYQSSPPILHNMYKM